MNGGMGASAHCYVTASNTPTSCPHAASEEDSGEGRGAGGKRRGERNEWDVCTLQLVHKPTIRCDAVESCSLCVSLESNISIKDC